MLSNKLALDSLEQSLATFHGAGSSVVMRREPPVDTGVQLHSSMCYCNCLHHENKRPSGNALPNTCTLNELLSHQNPTHLSPL